jgi:DNA-binding NtrC family response regulator
MVAGKLVELLMNKKVTPRILVVEDDEMFRDTVREILRDMGYKVRGARNLTKATKRLTRHTFDLVLSDIDIGDGSGFDVIQVARQAHPEAPIVLMSAGADPEIVRQALDSGAARFLPKPFGLTELMKTVETLLDSSASNTANGLSDANGAPDSPDSSSAGN